MLTWDDDHLVFADMRSPGTEKARERMLAQLDGTDRSTSSREVRY